MRHRGDGARRVVAAESSPSSRRGSIAASVAGWGRGATRASRPRRHDGAPLRRGEWRIAPPARSRSSPSSRRGSIAASTTASPMTSTPRSRPRRHDGAPLRHEPGETPAHLTDVVPVVTTGLHCGAPTSAGNSVPSAGRPRRHDGAPLRRGFRGRRGRMHRQVVPVVTTGLHCGRVFPPKRTGLHSVVPVVTTGLHCGAEFVEQHLPCCVSSPSSRRGSIAAPVARRRGQPRSSCRPRRHDGAPLRRELGIEEHALTGQSSPSSRRGSIAAPMRVAAAGRWTRRPRRHDGAPLRHVDHALPHGGRRGRPRRHDGAPLRPCTDLRPGVCGRSSSPSSRRGSIAAMFSKPGWSSSAWSSPSSRRGSIAASATTASRRTALPGRPRRHDGAPLRRLQQPHHGWDGVRRPRRHDGAPLRRLVGSRPRGRLARSSPSSRRGSIAAANSTRRPWVATSSRPRRHDGAPLRQGGVAEEG